MSKVFSVLKDSFKRAIDYDNNLDLKLINNKYGILERSTNNWVLKPTFDTATSFNYLGVSIVSLNRKYGLISRRGNILIKLIYDSIENFVGYDFTVYTVKQNNRYGLYSHKGELLFKVIYDNIKGIKKINNIKYMATAYNGKCGVVGENNIIAVPFIYDDISFTSFDLVEVINGGSSSIVSIKNNIIIPFGYRNHHYYSGGIIRAFKDTGNFLFNLKGQILFSDFKIIGYDNDRNELVVNSEGKRAKISENGKLINI